MVTKVGQFIDGTSRYTRRATPYNRNGEVIYHDRYTGLDYPNPTSSSPIRVSGKIPQAESPYQHHAGRDINIRRAGQRINIVRQSPSRPSGSIVRSIIIRRRR